MGSGRPAARSPPISRTVLTMAPTIETTSFFFLVGSLPHVVAAEKIYCSGTPPLELDIEMYKDIMHSLQTESEKILGKNLNTKNDEESVKAAFNVIGPNT